MPDYFYALAARLLADKLLTVASIVFGLIVGPLFALMLDHGKLYGVAVMAAGWWVVVLLLKFHPERRRHSTRVEDWFFAVVLDALALSVVSVVLMAASKG